MKALTNLRAWRLGLALAVVPAAVLLLCALPIGAQEETPPVETPAEQLVTEEPTVEEDIDPESNTVVRIDVAQDIQPIPEGEEFEASVIVENVEHLAAFDFTITYDPERLEPVIDPNATPEESADVSGGEQVSVLNLGQFIEESERGQSLSCPLHFVRGSEVTVSCNTFAAPVCLDGPEGASGTGTLATVLFRSLGGGDTTLTLSGSTLALDDIDPCDPEADFQVIRIPHRRQNAQIELEGGGSGGLSSGTVIGVAIGVIAVVAIAGSAGLVWYRRRQSGPPA
jgi:hypothetical protein